MERAMPDTVTTGRQSAGLQWGAQADPSLCIPTCMLASGLIACGMNWWQAVGTILLGNLIVLMPMVLNAHAGTTSRSGCSICS